MHLARNKERVSYLIRVTKKEAMEIRKKFPDLQVSRTCRQHPRRSTYYATESVGIMNLLEKIRRHNVVEHLENANYGEE